MDFSSVNWLAVVVAVVANMVLGFLWYGPFFGKAWMAEVGMKEEDMQGGGAGMYVIPVLATILMAIVMTHVIDAFGESGLAGGLTTAFWMWLGFFALTSLTNSAFRGNSTKLWALESGNHLLGFLITGTVLGLMG